MILLIFKFAEVILRALPVATKIATCTYRPTGKNQGPRSPLQRLSTRAVIGKRSAQIPNLQD